MFAFQPIAYYLGLGLGNFAQGGNLTFNVDLGVIYQGEAEVDISTSGFGVLKPLIDIEIAAAEAGAEKTLSSYAFYPILRVGLSYRFDF